MRLATPRFGRLIEHLRTSLPTLTPREHRLPASLHRLNLRRALKRAVASDTRFLLFIGPAVALGLALWMTVPDWGPRPPGGDDTLAHVIRAQFAANHLINHGRIDGWDPSFIVGYQEFLFDGPGLSWAAYVVRLLTLNTLSISGAIKVVAVGSFTLLPVTVAFAARAFGLGRRAAGLSAILCLMIDSPFGGVGLQGLFGIGLITNQLGALFFFLSFGGFLRVIRHREARWIVFTGVALCLLTITHGISVMILGVTLVIIVVLWVAGLQFPKAPALYSRIATAVREQLAERSSTGFAVAGTSKNMVAKSALETGIGLERAADLAANGPGPAFEGSAEISWRPLLGLVKATLLGLSLSAVVLLPLLAHRDLRGPLSGWTTPSLGQRLLQIWQGQILLRPAMVPFLLAGALYGLARIWKARPFALAVVATPIAFLVLAHTAFHYWPTNLLSMQLANRGLGYTGALAVLPLAALLARATRPLLLFGDLIAVVAALLLVLLPMGPERQEAQQMPVAVPQMQAAASVLRAVVPPSA
ncbi:MAG TPA: hypothetical protein VED59_01860, partial [Acidimicrobiales bacterium]|nr:hypothetical protein [Acidimicrobiales bacterium]